MCPVDILILSSISLSTLNQTATKIHPRKNGVRPLTYLVCPGNNYIKYQEETKKSLSRMEA